MKTISATALLALILAACTPGVMTPPGPGTAATGTTPVTFAVALDAKAFSAKEPITVRIWDAPQLQIMDETSACTVSYDARTGKETVTCPVGVTYRKAVAEEFQISRDDLAKGLTLASKTVTVGEAYSIAVTGKAADECNSASANQRGTAAGTTVTIANLPIATTQMACLPSR